MALKGAAAPATGNGRDDADEAALELLKQMIGLSAGVLALSGAFLEKLKPHGWPISLLLASWVVLLVALVAGLQGISAIVKSRLDEEYDWSTGYGRATARVCKYGFVAGIALFVAFAFASLTRRGNEPASSAAPCVGCVVIR
jgi:hypothetical protein